MKTLSEVRAQFDRELAQRAALPVELDVGIAEDHRAIFYLSLNDGDILTCALDAPGDCDAHDLIAALLSLGGTSARVH